MTFREQSPSVKHLLNRMLKLGWGEIENLLVKDGEPVIGSQTHIYKSIALDKQGTATPYRPSDELKPHVIQLLNEFRKIRNGTIPTIRIQDGLPIFLRVEEV
ncbi:hypothetical protein K8I28_16515 [bacterium]|nr:hypothetical protein [bacterium]